jgi:hypothetical protein
MYELRVNAKAVDKARGIAIGYREDTERGEQAKKKEKKMNRRC